MYKCYEEKGNRTGALENGRAVVTVLTSGGQGGPLWQGFISADSWMREGGGAKWVSEKRKVQGEARRLVSEAQGSAGERGSGGGQRGTLWWEDLGQIVGGCLFKSAGVLTVLWADIEGSSGASTDGSILQQRHPWEYTGQENPNHWGKGKPKSDSSKCPFLSR